MHMDRGLGPRLESTTIVVVHHQGGMIEPTSTVQIHKGRRTTMTSFIGLVIHPQRTIDQEKFIGRHGDM